MNAIIEDLDDVLNFNFTSNDSPLKKEETPENSNSTISNTESVHIINSENKHDLSQSEIYDSITEDLSRGQYVLEGKIYQFRTAANVPNLSLIERFVEKVISSDELGFNKAIKKRIEHTQEVTFKESKLSYYFKHINTFVSNVYQHEEYYIYSENVSLFLDACNALNLHLLRFFNPSYFHVDRNKYQSEIFNDLIEFIRAKSKTQEFKDKKRNRALNSDRMQSRLEKYVKGLFIYRSRQLVLRVDLGYATIQDERGFHRQEISLERAICDRDRFIANMRHNKLFDDMIGYIWKIEYADLKSYHFHWIFFFDNSEVRSDFYITNEIGLYWREVVTKNTGVFFNCNAKKSSYRYLGIGRIHAEDPADAKLRFNLVHYVLRYLTKAEQYLKVKLGGKSRVFGTGQVREKSPQGRPRKDWSGNSKGKPVDFPDATLTIGCDEEDEEICY